MDSAKNSGAAPSTAGVETCTTSKDCSRSLSTFTSFSSNLVSRQKLLTREEECTLKTALAFVVIKARTKARARESGTNRSNAVNKSNGMIKQQLSHSSISTVDGVESKHCRSIASPSSSTTTFGSSILDHLFRHSSKPSKSLECAGGRGHIDHMFRAAKTLAETWLVTNQVQKSATATTATSKALVGATGHLAHQLQLLLVANNNTAGTKRKRASKSIAGMQLSQTQSINLDRCTPRLKYRRNSSSSKSVANSTSTPSSQKDIGATVVTPATNGSHDNRCDSSNNSSRHINNKKCVDSTMGTAFLAQEWIRSTLLQQNDHQEDIVTGATETTKIIRTVLSCQNTEVQDVLASFHVYSVMIPQIARISPPLIGHVFQVVARVVKDLYDDKIMVVGKKPTLLGDDGKQSKTIDTNGNAKQLLDHLTTSALKLLELCWTTEIDNSQTRREEGHRSFLLLSLQDILGDLLVPLSRSELAGEHYKLTMSAFRNGVMANRKYQQVWQNGRHSEIPHSPDVQNHQPLRRQQRFVIQRQSKFEPEHDQTIQKGLGDRLIGAYDSGSVREEVGIQKDSRISLSSAPKPNRFDNGCFLEPEAKLLLRMAVYRLILMEKKR